jgi:hypothetical protein
MFINLTIKNLRELSKKEIFSQVHTQLILSILYLMKKNILLCRYYYNSLIHHQNIFNEQNFEKFFKTQKFSFLISQFQQNLKNSEIYFETFFQRLSKKSSLISTKFKNTFEDSKLDNLLKSVFDELLKEDINFSVLVVPHLDVQDKSSMLSSKTSSKAIDINSCLMNSSVKLKKEYFMALAQFYYSIYCDKSFPLFQDNKFFDWKQFDKTLKASSVVSLQQIIES